MFVESNVVCDYHYSSIKRNKKLVYRLQSAQFNFGFKTILFIVFIFSDRSDRFNRRAEKPKVKVIAIRIVLASNECDECDGRAGTN